MSLVAELGSHLTGIEQLQAMMKTGRRPGFLELLDAHLIEVEDGRIVLEATPGEHVYNPNGTVHGGFAAVLLDTVCGYAVMSKMGTDHTFTTLELKVAYHRAMTHETGPTRAEGKIVTIGRRAAFTEARLTDRKGTLYASATSSLLVISKNPSTQL
jgi:uncharacterized protein (TIGR00369 family)